MRVVSLFVIGSIALLAVAVMAAASPNHSHHKSNHHAVESSADELAEFFRLKSAFDAYRVRFNREYNEEQHPEEYAARFQHFQDSVKRSEQRNKDHNTNVFGLTKFSDMSRDDFRKTYLTYKPNPGFESDFNNGDITTTLPAHTKTDIKKLPTEVDWRKAGVVTNVNDQGQCGACWAFSATETVESAFLQANPSYLSEVANGWGLSVEEMIDCKNFGLFGGCQGGWADLGYEWVKTNGLMNATEDPYTAGDGTTGVCLPLAKPVTYLKSYSFATPPCLLDCSKQKMDVLQQSIATIAPISICLDAGAWDDYTGGVFPASSCNSGFTNMDHCVQLVGYSINATDPTQSYWLVRNSWNTNWGVAGYIHLQFDYSINTCGMANQATNVQLNATKEWDY